ncbi:type II toxin-antitoxin system VapC family toxin [Bosea caraganae]|uniref:Type II toxin-antitoxin system VapC family toxin n=1 Tax=Bosea caraganae TaxID=2763117 RepID=A0A370L738_9HYPH|nr:type II toxin-antitoxin system VapC family toxin [Bosea caraganae]RDJ26001.1 type II toxin-antitoxin system VapC family toxin [Bosea caraganae]
MRLLLDTSALLWFWLGGRALRPQVLGPILDRNNQVHVSSISAMEIATKHRVGKLPGVENVLATFADALAADGFIALPLSNEHALLAGAIPGEHRDPFDRMLAAQAIIEELTIVSSDAAFDALGARRLW